MMQVSALFCFWTKWTIAHLPFLPLIEAYTSQSENGFFVELCPVGYFPD